MLGSPIGHSLSPILHRAAYAALGLTGWRYDAIECTEEQLPVRVGRLGPEWAGLSLTMPLKRAALAVATETSELAGLVGAANTLLPLAGGGWRADNTDVAGMVRALREAGVGHLGRAPAGAAVVLGAGGTAQAALAALTALGVRAPTVLVRDRSRADDLLAAADRIGVAPAVHGWEDIGLAAAAAVVVCTLPVGGADALAGLAWRPGAFLLDVVYAPSPTPLAAAAAAAGARVVSGSAMLLHQAAVQVELMTGQPAPVAAMRAALSTALSVPTAGLRAVGVTAAPAPG